MKKENLLKTYQSQWRPEAAIRSDILYLFGQGNLIFLSGKSQGKVREFWKVMTVATMNRYLILVKEQINRLKSKLHGYGLWVLSMPFELRSKTREFLADFLPQFHHGRCHIASASVVHVQFHDEMAENDVSFLSVNEGENEWKQLQVTVILEVNKCLICTQQEISYLNFPTISIGLRKLVLLNWATFMCGDGKLQKAVFGMKWFSFRSKVFKIYFRQRVERRLDNKTLPEHEWKMNMRWISLRFERRLLIL